MENKILVKGTILENEKLVDIIKKINLGLLQYSDEKNLRITNPNKKGFVIIIAEVVIMDNIVEFLQTENKFPHMDYKTEFNKLEAELTIQNYVVLTLESNGNTQKIINIPLFELIIASENLISDESGKHKLDLLDDNVWDLQSTGWNCYDIHYTKI